LQEVFLRNVSFLQQLYSYSHPFYSILSGTETGRCVS